MHIKIALQKKLNSSFAVLFANFLFKLSFAKKWVQKRMDLKIKEDVSS